MTTARQFDLTTINGLLAVSQQGIEELLADPTDQNIRKQMAINQLLASAQRTHMLAFNKERVANLVAIQGVEQQDINRTDYLPARLLGGKVFGDTEKAETAEHEAEQRAARRNYEDCLSMLCYELDNNDANTSTEAYQYADFSNRDIEILNRVLARAGDKEFGNRYEQTKYLLDAIKPSDYGVEA